MESFDREPDPFQRALLTQIKRLSSSGSNVPNLSNGYFTECRCMSGAVGNPYSIEGCSYQNGNGSSSSSSSVNSGNGGNYDVINDNNKIFSDDLEQASSSSSSSILIPTDPCTSDSDPCGAHSICVAHKGQAFCRCDFDAVGEPPNCKLRCGKDQHCLFDQVCKYGGCVSATEATEDEQRPVQHSTKQNVDDNFLK